METRLQSLRTVTLSLPQLAITTGIAVAAVAGFLLLSGPLAVFWPLVLVAGLVVGTVIAYVFRRITVETRRDYVQALSLLARARDTRDSAIRTAEQWERLYRGADERAERLADELAAARQGATA